MCFDTGLLFIVYMLKNTLCETFWYLFVYVYISRWCRNENPLDSKETQPVHLKGNQPWILIGRTDAEGEAPVFWSPDANSQLIGKVPDAGRDWGQKEKRVSEDETAGRHQHCSRCELGQTPGDGEGQGGLACHSHRVANSQTQLDDWTIMHIC